MTAIKVSDDYIISGLINMNPEVIDLVFYQESECRAHMEMAIKKIWGTKDQYISVVLMSFCHYLTNNNLKRIKEWRVSVSSKKKDRIPFTQLLQDALLDFLARRIKYKDESHYLYSVLTGTDDSLPMIHKRLDRKDALNQYLWGNGSRLDAIVSETIGALNDLYEQNLASKEFREQIRQALCVHPEKILEAYDFSEPLADWRETILKRRLSQICSLYLIDRLLAHDEVVTERLFYPGSRNWEAIGESISSAWEVCEDVTAVIKTFIYFLIIRSNGKELRTIKKIIAREVPYYALPFRYDGKQPKKWFHYDDEVAFPDLLMESASIYAKKRKEYKEERKELGKLMLNPDNKVRTDFLWGVDGEKYKVKIDKAIEDLKKIGIKIDSEILKNNLFHYLCDDTIGLLVRYDFNKFLKDWCRELAESYIEDRPRLDVLLSGHGANKLFEEEYKDLIYIARQYNVKGKSVVMSEEDFVQDLFVLLYENDRKTIKNFKFESRLHSYIVKIATNRLKHDKKIVEEQEVILNDIISGELKVEKKKEPEIDLRDKAGIYESLIKLLRKPGMKEYFGFGKRSNKIFWNQLEIIERVYVNLVEFTSKEQEEKRKELIEQFGSISDNPKAYLNGNEKRAREILEKVKNDIQKIIESRGRLSLIEKDILREFGIDETLYSDYSYGIHN